MGIKRFLFYASFMISLILPFEVLGQGYILGAENRLSNPDIIPLYEEAGLYYTADKELADSLLEKGEAEFVHEDTQVQLPRIPLTPMLFSVDNTDNTWQITEPESDCLSLFKLDGTGVRIGIVDSGVNFHKDLPAFKIVASENFATNKKGETISDINDYDGHGTAVASVICGQGTLGNGVVGIAPGAELVNAKWCVAEGGRFSDVIKAFAFCDMMDCDVINLSLGTDIEINDYTDFVDLVLLKRAIDTATERNIVVVVATGNCIGDSINSYDFISYPAGFDNVIGVASVGKGFVHAPTSKENESVFISAPGEMVMLAGIKNTAEYIYGSGTSFAAPYVAGLVALIKQVYPDADTTAVKEILKACATDLGEEGYDISYGYGIVSGRALAKYLRQTGIYTYQEDDDLYGVSLDGDKTILNLERSTDGIRPVIEYSEISAKDKVKTLLGRIQNDGVKKFFWERESLKPLCSSY